MLQQQSQKVRLFGSHIQVYCDNFHNRLSVDFQNRVLLCIEAHFLSLLPCMVFNKHILLLYLPRKTCLRHLETGAANVWDLIQRNQSPFQKTLLVFYFFYFF